MYQIKVFSASTPEEVEGQANRWLRQRRDNIRLMEVAPTDVIQVSPESGMQRFTLVLAYETD